MGRRNTPTIVDPELSMRQSIKQHQRWAKTPDRNAATAAARAKAEGRFLARVREQFPNVDEATAAKMAANARKAFYLQLAKRSAEARRLRARAA